MAILRKSVPYKYAILVIGVMVVLIVISSVIDIRNNQTAVDETVDEPVTNQIKPKESTSSVETKKPKQTPNTDNKDTSIAENTKPPAEKTPTPPPSNKTVTVRITGSGFSPVTVMINAGDSVKWVNDDNQSHWPASDEHPQHTGYPGFDSFGIAASSSWSFKFGNKGSWGYHDHQFPNETGTVVVN